MLGPTCVLDAYAHVALFLLLSAHVAPAAAPVAAAAAVP
jgi:hypothetical protein